MAPAEVFAPTDRSFPMKRATAFLAAGLMRKDSFARESLEEAIADYVRSPGLAARTSGVECDYTGSLLSDGVVQVRYTTRLKGLTDHFALKHKYSFPLLNEVRETGFVLDLDRPAGTSEILIAMKDEKKGYFNIAIHDDENYLLHCSVLTYDRKGRVKPYVPVFHDKFVSPLELGHASLGEALDERGRRVFRLTLELKNLEGDTQVKVGYNTAGIHETRVFDVGPCGPVVVSDLLLEDNPRLLPGDWVIGATDEHDRMLVNGLVWLEAMRDVAGSRS
jgi:hypothetical protein